MTKVDPTVKAETVYIGSWVVILSVVLQAVFLILGKWDYTVLLGNLLSGALAIGNFLLLGLTVQRAVEKEEADAKTFMKLSLTLRNIMLFVVVVIGIVLPWFNTWTVLIPVFFPRIAMLFRGLFKKTS
ncbi:MAG: hypothetical protein IKU26_05655 [Clostridia bacterium]|nr:hypothetical protein [Clostridia bacterium]